MAWKLAHAAWAALFIVGWFFARYLWGRVDALAAKMTDMQMNALENHVTKRDMKEAFDSFAREHIAPLNSSMRALIKALAAQEIHVDRHRD